MAPPPTDRKAQDDLPYKTRLDDVTIHLVEQSLEKLLITIDNISPKELSSKSHVDYARQITATVEASLVQDPTTLLTLIGSIRDCSKPCYKRDLLLEVLDLIVNQEGSLPTELLSDPFRVPSKKTLWKEYANLISSLPDLVANCHCLDKYTKFEREMFYSMIVRRLFGAIQVISHRVEKIPVDHEHKLLFLQLIGRLAISGAKQLLWDELFSRALGNDDKRVQKFLSDLIAILLDSSQSDAIQFTAFIEPICLPLFHNVRPSEKSGCDIALLIGDHLLRNESFQYLLLNKQILQTNYNCDKEKQNVILLNVFAYLSHLSQCDNSEANLLIKTILDIAKNWSNGPRVVLRTYKHNEYITKALVIAVKFAIKHRGRALASRVLDLQTILVGGIPLYLNRANSETRALAICMAQIILPRLHQLYDEFAAGPNAHEIDDPEPEFDVQLSDDCLAIKRLFEADTIDQIFPINEQPLVVAPSPNIEEAATECDEFDITDLSEDVSKVPIYLSDCLAGLLESENARYVKLCLAKTCELLKRFDSGDAVRDLANELAQILLYLDNQFNIEGFDFYRMSALDSLCILAPDLVVKYLLDEFNGPNKSTRHQLDILQILVSSAQYLSSNTHHCASVINKSTSSRVTGRSNKLVELAPLYFYGIVHRLKAELNSCGGNVIQPATSIVAAAKTFAGSASQAVGGRRESMIRRVITGLANSRSQLSGLDNQTIPLLQLGSASSRPPGHANSRRLLIGGSGGGGGGAINGCDDDYSLREFRARAAAAAQSDGDLSSDDSYLLSRIFLSLSLIINCLNQQPITCRLSNDLLDILAAYRYHPDSGVRRAILGCLKSVRDCTPSVYFSESLEDKTVKLFGAWLSTESELLARG